MFRRIRSRRAARAERRAGSRPPNGVGADKLDHQNNKTIFRGKQSNSRQLSYLPSLTMTLSQDDDDTPYTPLSSYSQTTLSCTGSKADLLSEAVHISHQRALSKKEQQIFDLENTISELKQCHDEIIAEKDEAIILSDIALAFSKEDRSQVQSKMRNLTFILELKESMVKRSQRSIDNKNSKIAKLLDDLKEMKESVEALSSTLLENQTLLQDKEEQVIHLQKSLDNGKRSAQVIAGFLTLGAMCSSDSP